MSMNDYAKAVLQRSVMEHRVELRRAREEWLRLRRALLEQQTQYLKQAKHITDMQTAAGLEIDIDSPCQMHHDFVMNNLLSEKDQTE